MDFLVDILSIDFFFSTKLGSICVQPGG